MFINENKLRLNIFVLLAVIITASFLFFQNATYADTLRFVQISDVHFTTLSQSHGKRDLSNSKYYLQKAISNINNLKDVDFVIFTGDSIDSPAPSELEKFALEAKKLKYPWYVALGNHEVTVSGNFKKTEYFNILKKHNKYIKNEGKPYYAFNQDKKYLFIAADGVIEKHLTAGGYFDKPQLNQIEKIIKNNPKKKIIIFQHFPLIEPSQSHDHKVLNAEEYLNMLYKYKNVFMIASGHYHVDKVTNKNGIIFVSTSSLVQTPHEFRIITINDNNNKYSADFNLISIQK